MTNEITNYDDIIDSRDVIERINDLELVIESLDDHEKKELETLKGLTKECEGYSDWEYGAVLIRNSYFTEYAEQLAEDIGAIETGGNWPTYCIDWEWAARELKMDYTCVDFDGVDYWIRS